MEPINTPATQITHSVESTWGIDRVTGGCLKCGHSFLLPANRMGMICPNCFSGKLEEQPAIVRQEPPELSIPFQIGSGQLKDIYTKFCQGMWLAPDEFNPEFLLKNSIKVFWPLWLVDCNLRGVWQAEEGYEYQVKSSVEAYNGSQWNTQEKIETRTRWEIRKGMLDRHYDNISSPAIEDYRTITGKTGNYSFGKTKPYRSADINDALIRIPDMPPESTWPSAVQGINRAAEQECMEASGGLYSRNFSIEGEYADQNWSQMLLPMIVSYYRGDDNQVFPIVVNGQTGQISGIRAASQRKGWIWAGISAGIAILLFLLGILLTAIPPVSILGVLLIALAFGAGILAIVSAIWPWVKR